MLNKNEIIRDYIIVNPQGASAFFEGDSKHPSRPKDANDEKQWLHEELRLADLFEESFKSRVDFFIKAILDAVHASKSSK